MKKHPIIIAILSVCAVAFLAGIAFTAVAATGNAKTRAKIEKEGKELKRLANRAGEFALSEENVQIAEENLAGLKRAGIEKFGAVAAPKFVVSNFSGDSTTLISGIKDAQQELKKKFVAAGAEVAPDAGNFGFSRYLSNSGEAISADKLRRVDSESRVIETVMSALLAAQEEHEKNLHSSNIIAADQKVFFSLRAVRREAFELTPEQRRNVQKDELIIVPDVEIATTGLAEVRDGTGKIEKIISLRRPGILDAMVLQVEFVGDSAVLRGLLEKLKDYSLYARDLRVSRTPANMLPQKAAASADSGQGAAPAADPFSFFGVAPAATPATAAAPRAKARIVVEEGNPELFTLTLEYLTPHVSADKKDDNAENEPEKK